MDARHKIDPAPVGSFHTSHFRLLLSQCFNCSNVFACFSHFSSYRGNCSHQLTVTSSGCTVVFYAYKHYAGPPVTLAIPVHIESPFCPVQAMCAYLALRGLSPGPLFIFPGGAPVIKSFFTTQLKKSLTWAGLTPSCYKGHSFRIGAIHC